MVSLLKILDVHDASVGENSNMVVPKLVKGYLARPGVFPHGRRVKPTRCGRSGPVDHPLNGEIGIHIGGR